MTTRIAGRVAALLLLLLSTGCQSAEMMDAMDRGLAHEKEGRVLERSEAYPAAAERYAESEESLAHALEIAKDRENNVFVSFLTTKLSIVTASQAQCTQPDRNPAGTWARAYELYDRAAGYAARELMLRLKRNAHMGQAYCVRPDKNPEGAWAQAAELYAMCARLAEQYEYPDEQAEALREQARCLVEGDTSQLTPEARKLLEKARRLGDEEAAELLSASDARYCNACGEPLREADRFCKRCGQDQAVTRPAGDRPERKLQGPGTRPPGAEGPGGGGPGGR